VPRKVRELRDDLRRAGFRQRPVSSGHTIWVHPLVAGHVSVSGHDGDDALRYQERDVRAYVAKARQADQQQKGGQP